MLFLVLPLVKTNQFSSVSQVFTKLSINSAFLIDVFYHKKTLGFLKKLHIYTLGAVPLIYNSKNLDFSLPTTTDNSFAQFFNIQLLLYLKKQSEYSKYKSLLNL